MFIPIRTDYRMSHKPWVNYGLVAANVLVYLLGFNGLHDKLINDYMLHPDSPQIYQFFTSVFLHANFWHIAGNMLFLWVFGGPLNDRLGHVAYLAFYLAGGVLASLGFVLLAGGSSPLLGASGAISAVTGAYLVLLPQIRLTVLMVFYYITTFTLSSLYFVGFQFVYNILMTVTGTGGTVAVEAHSSGYVFGIAVGFFLLATKLVPRDQTDLLSMISHARRRGRYRRMVSQGYKPFQSDAGTRGAESSKQGRWVDARSVRSEPSDTEQARELGLRQEIASACARHDMVEAARKYLQLVQIAEDAVLSRQAQLDVANQLMSQEQYPAAADAYERFLNHYGAFEHSADIHLMLGLIYGRYLHQYDRAEHYLTLAATNLTDESKAAMARTELDAARRRRGS